MQLSNKKWPLDFFMAQRKTALSAWPTGEGVAREEAIKYQEQIPPMH